MKWKLALITLALFSNLLAEPRQWDLDGLAVRQTYDLQWNGQTARADDGSVMMVWTDARTGHFELFGQLLSPSGEPQWGEDGRFLARSEGLGIYWPVITYSIDGWVVLWQDDDFYNTSEEVVIRGRMKTMKFAASGQPLWNDPEQTGVLIYTEQTRSFQENALWIAPDGTGGAYVCWINEYDFFAQRVANDGSLSWESPLQFDHQFGGWGYAVGSNGAGNLVLVWKSFISGFYDINCRMIGPDGSNVWASPTQVCHVPGYITNTEFVADGAGGVVVVWFEERFGEVYDAFAQRVSGDGATVWQANGVSVVVRSEHKYALEVTPSLNAEQVDGVLVKWEQGGFYRRGYVQKFDLDGDVLWQAGGVELCEPQGTDTTQTNFTIVSDRQGGTVCEWVEDINDWDPGVLRLSRINESGQLVWQTCGVDVVIGDYLRTPRISVTGAGNIISIWKDGYNLDGFMFAHAHDMDTGDELIPEVLSLDGMLDGDAYGSALLALPEGRVVMAWQDSRQGGRQLYFQILDADGTNEYEHDGIKLVETPDGVFPQADDLSLCSDGSGGFFAAFTDLSSGFRVARVTHWNADGEQVGPPEGVVVSNPNSDVYSYYSVMVTPDDEGGAYVAYSEFDVVLFQLDVYVTRISGNCQPLWNEPSMISDDLVNDDMLAGLVASDNGSCIAVWQTGTFGAYSYRAARVTADGIVDWSIWATTEGRNAANLQVASDMNSEVAFVWVYGNLPSERDIYAQRIDPDGVLAWEAGGVPIATTDNTEYSPQIAVDDQGNAIVAWLRSLPQSEYDLYAQKISPTGQLLWPTDGILIDQASSNTELSSVVAVNYENIYFTWTAHPDPGHSLVYVSHINAAGELADDPYWQPNGTVLCDAADVIGYPKTVATNDGGIIVVWGDWRAHNLLSSIYAQRIYDPIPTAVDLQPVIPTEFSLAQNYPNPFNPETVIEFALPNASKATLKVFDVTGRAVATLLDEPMTAGVHRVGFDAQRLPSGVYFYTLQAAGNSMTHKMVLLK